MKITDIIRTVLDLVDRAEIEKPKEPEMQVTVQAQGDPDELARIKQIAGLLTTGETEYSNSPEEKVADVDAVIASGTDLMKSKHPADIRGEHPSMYPFSQWRGE
jgi:hypothetical protein